MASIVKCANGHFYDADKSPECPYCSEQNSFKKQYEQNFGAFPGYADENPGDGVTVAAPVNGPSSVQLERRPETGVQGLSANNIEETVSIYQGVQGLICAWLVGLSGHVKGRDYRIFHGIRWVGRSYHSDIVLREVNGVAEEKHCGIVYDSKSNKFYVIPGSGTLTYFNGRVVDRPCLLRLGDVLGIGDANFEFIPFCREGHVWEQEKDG